MKVYTLDDIRALEPCYDPADALPEGWTGTLVDVLRLDAVPPADRVWFATKVLDGRNNRLFAVWCARRILARVENPEPMVISAVDVAERYAKGQATDEELKAARDAAWPFTTDYRYLSAWHTTHALSRGAAWDAAWVAAWGPDWDIERQAQVDYLLDAIENVPHNQ